MIQIVNGHDQISLKFRESYYDVDDSMRPTPIEYVEFAAASCVAKGIMLYCKTKNLPNVTPFGTLSVTLNRSNQLHFLSTCKEYLIDDLITIINDCPILKHLAYDKFLIIPDLERVMQL
jgi:hypothetical protein